MERVLDRDSIERKQEQVICNHVSNNIQLIINNSKSGDMCFSG